MVKSHYVNCRFRFVHQCSGRVGFFSKIVIYAENYKYLQFWSLKINGLRRKIVSFRWRRHEWWSVERDEVWNANDYAGITFTTTGAERIKTIYGEGESGWVTTVTKLLSPFVLRTSMDIIFYGHGADNGLEDGYHMRIHSVTVVAHVVADFTPNAHTLRAVNRVFFPLFDVCVLARAFCRSYRLSDSRFVRS